MDFDWTIELSVIQNFRSDQVYKFSIDPITLLETVHRSIKPWLKIFNQTLLENFHRDHDPDWKPDPDQPDFDLKMVNGSGHKARNPLSNRWPWVGGFTSVKTVLSLILGLEESGPFAGSDYPSGGSYWHSFLKNRQGFDENCLFSRRQTMTVFGRVGRANWEPKRILGCGNVDQGLVDTVAVFRGGWGFYDGEIFLMNR